MVNVTDENWRVLLSLLPDNWESLAAETKAVERLRGFGSAESVLRTLLLHVGKGYSLRETAVLARQSGLADVSDVTILNRLRQAESWWKLLCQFLLQESGVDLPDGPGGRRVRLLDGTLVKEPGRTGSQWRIHYSLRVPSLLCDYLDITATHGQGTGETLHRFPAHPGDLVLGDRGFCSPAGIAALQQQGADVLVRWHSSRLPLFNSGGQRFHLLPRLDQLPEPGEVQAWTVMIDGPQSRLAGRICALRKSEAAARKALRNIKRKAQMGGPEPKPETLAYAAYVIVFSTLPAEEFSAQQVLEWYRVRWQIDLAFKRWKSLAQMGHLPKQDDSSARAWLYGKLLLALLGQKIIRIGRAISPWGYLLPAEVQRQSLA